MTIAHQKNMKLNINISKRSLINHRTDLFLLLIIASLAALTFFFRLGDYSLFNPDEGLYAEPAREMLETGEYVTTLLNYAVRFTKPPLVIWAMALSYQLFGINEFAARLFSAICAFLLTLITYLFANKYLGRRTAIIATLMLLTCPLFIGVGRMAITDMPLSLFLAGALFSFYHAWAQRKSFWLWPGYILTALAVMTKGPVGLILPALIMASLFIVRKEARAAIKFFQLPLGSILIAIIALPWFIIEIATTHGAYFQEFILRENFARFTSVVDSHKGHWWYHIAAVFGGMFPWSIILPQAVLNICKNALKTEKSNVLLFMLIWSVITIGFFSASVSKLIPYTLPAFPALAIMIAFQWNSFIETKAKKSMLIYCSIIALVYAAATFITPVALQHLRNHPPQLESVICHYSFLACTLTLLSILIILSKREAVASLFLFVATTVLTIISVPKVLNVVGQFWEGTIPQYAEFARRSNLPLLVYDLRKPAIPFYFRRRVYQTTNKQELDTLINQLGQGYLVTKMKHANELTTSGCKLIANDTNFALLTFPKESPAPNKPMP